MRHYLMRGCTAAVTVFLISGVGNRILAQEEVLQGPELEIAQLRTEEIPEPEVLEQGPIHEAFAEPFSLEKTPEAVISEQPPEPIQELPPELRPEGDNVVWVPGYWAWSHDLEDFVWVSGLWRDIPPGRKWIPGDWAQVEGGWQWVSGYWADDAVQEVQYLPTPPESLEVGPSSPAPGNNYLWAPGCWQYQTTGYVWQPGTWYQASPNYVYVPSHYRYTPYGSVFINGYWDYPLVRRGLLYAPVYWGGRLGGGYYPGVAWRPYNVINTALLISSFFVDRNYGHYYYGYNYYGGYPNWLTPWGSNFSRWGYYGGRHRSFDPLYAHHHWRNPNWRHDHDRWDRDRGHAGGPRGDWRDGPRGDGRRGDGPGDRGPRDGDGRRRDIQLVTTPTDLRNVADVKLRQVTREELAQQTRRAEQYREFNRNRRGNRINNLTVEERTRVTEDGRIERQVRSRAPNRGELQVQRENVRERVDASGNVVRRGEGTAEGRVAVENRTEFDRRRGNIRERLEANNNVVRRGEVAPQGQVTAESRTEAARQDGRTQVENRQELRGQEMVRNRELRRDDRVRIENRGQVSQGDTRTRVETTPNRQATPETAPRRVEVRPYEGRTFPRAENRARVERNFSPGQRTIQGENQPQMQVTPRGGQFFPRTEVRPNVQTEQRSSSNYRTMRVPSGDSGPSFNRGNITVAPRGDSGVPRSAPAARGNFGGGGDRGPVMQRRDNEDRGPGMRAPGGGRRGR